MKEQAKQRLQELQKEFESGQQMLADLQAKEEKLQQTLLRISGAMQILKELLQAEEEPPANNQVSDVEVENLAGESVS